MVVSRLSPAYDANFLIYLMMIMMMNIWMAMMIIGVMMMIMMITSVGPTDGGLKAESWL